MANVLRDYWKYLAGALVLHGAFAALFFAAAISMNKPTPPPQLAIQAVLVDAASLPANRQRQEEERRTREEAARRAEEQRRQEEEAKQREQERQKQEQAEEPARQETARREEQAKQAEVVRQQQAAEQQKRAEAERQQKAEAQRKERAEADRKRVAEIERKQREEEEKRRAAAEARAQSSREDELKRQLQEEEGVMQARNSGAGNQYIAMLQQHIERRWNRPASARPGLECEVKVAQAPGGTVLSVQVGRCNGDDAVRQSIETAVYRASPLPPPPDPRLFERNLVLIFKPAE